MLLSHAACVARKLLGVTGIIWVLRSVLLPHRPLWPAGGKHRIAALIPLAWPLVGYQLLPLLLFLASRQHLF